jgi:hypothetical protein
MKPLSSFIAITSEGGLLPADFLRELPDPKTSIEGVTPVEYHLAEGERLNEQINRSWHRLKGCWENFKKAIAGKQSGEPTTTETRERWLLPLFQELDFGRVTIAKPIEVDGRSYPVSHGWNQVPIHLVGSHADLDRRTPGAVGAAKASPHSLVQSALNASEDHLWGMLSNGFNLRLLRDNIALTRLAYVEFDLQAMFDGDLYSEFFVLWLVCHQSRFEGEKPDGGPPQICWLERWKKAAEDKTLRALDDLYPGVKKAIAALGAGLVSHHANQVLLEKLRTGRLTTQEFYKQVLRVIYRMLFLLVAEDRALLHPVPLAHQMGEGLGVRDSQSALPNPHSAFEQARRRYRDFYSITRLRALTFHRAGTPHPDLWHVFQFVTAKLGSDTGCPELALPPLGSFLWTAAQSTPDLLDSLISNRHFLEAVHALAFVQDGNVRRAVDYKNLGSEELGSVYQGLLEMHPRINADAGTFELDIAAGNERKTSGSYYTPDSLVQCLLDSALEPVIAETIESVRSSRRKEAQPSATHHASRITSDQSLVTSAVTEGEAVAAALLSLKVCDMAVGSGYFPLRAAHRIARHLARVRSGEEEPSPAVYRTALRDVIGHCLYGVDINPLAVELCKVTLWLEALEPGKPLGFLDHHIRCGNSVLGAKPDLISAGLPDDAFEAIEGDDKAACSSLKKLNRAQREGLRHLFIAEDTAIRERMRRATAAIDEMSDSRPEDIHRKEAAFRDAQSNYDFGKAWDLANLWCAAFVIRKHFPVAASEISDLQSQVASLPVPTATQTGLFGGTEETPKTKKTKTPSRASSGIPIGITTQHLRDFVEGGALPDGLLAEAKRLADRYQFFHFHLAFSEVSAQGGFDISLGNPPWERVKLQEREWFAASHPNIAEAQTASIRATMIEQLAKTEPAVFTAFKEAIRHAQAESSFVTHSGRFPLGAVGDTNTYPLFIEAGMRLISTSGRVGLIVKTGILADYSFREFFSHLVQAGRFVSGFDFSNRRLIFPAVVANERFTLLTLAGAGSERFRVSILNEEVADLQKPENVWELTHDDIALINPNTLTCPLFQTASDAKLVAFVYRRVPILTKESDLTGGNPLGALYVRMFDMTLDSSFFRDLESLQNRSQHAPAPRWPTSEGIFLSLLEGKLYDLFDHRHGTFAVIPRSARFGIKAEPNHPTTEEKLNPEYECLPRYWVAEDEVHSRYVERLGFEPGGVLSFRDVCRTHTDLRTVRAAICPTLGAGNKAPLLLFPGTSRQEHAVRSAVLCANLGAFALDYIARQKFAGGSLNKFILIQLPCFPPATYGNTCRWNAGAQTLKDWLLPRVLELIYTAWDLEAFAQDCGWPGPPFRWDEERRFLLRCELDAAFFHLYLGPETEWRQEPTALTQAFPTSRAAVSYILDTFPIVKRKDETKWGDYRTKRVILEVYDALTEAMQTGKVYQTRLTPAPASIAVAHPPRFGRERVNFKEPGDYVLPFVGSLLRHQGGECDLMKLIRAYAMLLGDRKTLSALAEARFGTTAEAWVKRFNQPVDASWFLPIVRGLDNRDVLKLEERGENDVFVRLLDTSVPSNPTVETDVYLLLHVLDLNAVPPAAVAEQVKRIAPKPVRMALQEAKPVPV